MTLIDQIKNRLIDRIKLSKNQELLSAIDDILNSVEPDERLELNSHQIEMLMMSEKDIEQGNLISESDLKKADSEWMK